MGRRDEREAREGIGGRMEGMMCGWEKGSRYCKARDSRSVPCHPGFRAMAGKRNRIKVQLDGSKCRKVLVPRSGDDSEGDYGLVSPSRGPAFQPIVEPASSSATSAAVHLQRAKDENAAENVTAAAASRSQRATAAAASASAYRQGATLGSTSKPSTEPKNTPKPPAAPAPYQLRPKPDAKRMPTQPEAPSPAHLLPKPDAKRMRPAGTAMDIARGRPFSTVAEAKEGKETICPWTGPNNSFTVVKCRSEGEASALLLQGKCQADDGVGADETQAQPKKKGGASQPVAGNDCAASANPKSNSSSAKSVATLTTARSEGQHSSTTKSEQIGARDDRPHVSLSPSSSGQSDEDQPHAARSEPSQPVARPLVILPFIGCTLVGRFFYEKARRSADVYEPFWASHKNAELALLNKEGTKQWRLFKEFEMSDLNRAMTRNWDHWLADTLDGCGIRKTNEELMFDQIKVKLRNHSGEARTWPPTQTERWVLAAPRIRALVLVASMASEQLQAHQKSADREKDCVKGDRFADLVSGEEGCVWRPKDIFSSDYAVEECTPDFENAISTLAVYDCSGQKVCLREVSCITLGELFYNCGKEHTYAELYMQWVMGYIVIKRRTFQGPRSKAKRVGWIISITRRGWGGGWWVINHPPPPTPTDRQLFLNLRFSGFSNPHSNFQQMFFFGWVEQFQRKLR